MVCIFRTNGGCCRRSPINFGARFDGVDEFTNENQVSPRVNVVWKPTSTTTIHAGYSRYFVPPPFELVSRRAYRDLRQYDGRTCRHANDPVKAERSHYFDVGINQMILPGLTVGIDGYYKLATNLIDEGQFGAPIILTAFNYARASRRRRIHRQLRSGAMVDLWQCRLFPRDGKNIISAQFNFPPDELAYIASTISISIMIRHGPVRPDQLHVEQGQLPPECFRRIACAEWPAPGRHRAERHLAACLCCRQSRLVQKLDIGLGKGQSCASMF